MQDKPVPPPSQTEGLAILFDGKTVFEVRREGMYLDGVPVWADTHGFLRWGHGEPTEPDDFEENPRGSTFEQASRPR